MKLITAQTEWAVELPEVKAHLRESGTSDDAYIQELIYAAQAKVEEEYDLGLSAATWELELDVFPDVIEIWKWPVASVSSVKYYAADETDTTVSSSNYKTDLVHKPARIVPYDSYAWPEPKSTWPNNVRVQFVTGFTSPAVVPGDIKQALYLIIADMMDNREDKGRRFQRVSERLLNKYRYR